MQLKTTMCDWSYLSLLNAAQYCSGYNGCSITLEDGSFGLAVSPTVVFNTEGISDNKPFTLLSNIFGATDIRNLTIANGEIVEAYTDSYGVDPWTLGGFRVLGKIQSHDKEVMVTDHGYHGSDTAPSLAACTPQAGSTVNLLAYFLLPYSRSLGQIWKNALITPSWPLAALPLVIANDRVKNRYNFYENFVLTFLICDCLFWLGHGSGCFTALLFFLLVPLILSFFILVAAFESYSVDTIGHFVILFNLTVPFLAIQGYDSWKDLPFACLALALLSFSFSSFYYTPIALLIRLCV